MNDELLPTPGQVATNEAARQAVMLVFGVVTAMIVLRLQAKYGRHLLDSDPDAERTARMRDAQRLERVWERVAHRVGGVAVWCWRQADKARAQYERERA